MNRAERRANGIKSKQPTYNMSADSLKSLKRQAADEATDRAFILMLGIPVMIMHDKFGQLMKKEVNGVSREQRFCEMCLDLFDSFEKGYFTLDELKACLKEEAGVHFERE